MKEQLEVTDLKGNKIGVMNVSEYLLNLFTNLYYICPQNASYIKWKYMEDNDFYQEDYSPSIKIFGTYEIQFK